MIPALPGTAPDAQPARTGARVMKPAHLSLALAALVAVTTPLHASDVSAEAKVVAFNATVRVEVDSAGKPVKVEAPADLPEAIRSYIEKRVGSWQYQPAKQDGVPAPAVTYVRVGACAMPVVEGYRLGLDFKGNGPGLMSASGRMPPPRYPRVAQVGGVSGVYQVSYAIRPDGGTRLEDIRQLEGAGGRYLQAFRDEISAWVETLQYQPELVNGEPVATTMSFPVEFELRMPKGGRAQWRESYRAELEARAIASKECIAASASDGLQPIAQNSPVKVTPVPAG